MADPNTLPLESNSNRAFFVTAHIFIPGWMAFDMVFRTRCIFVPPIMPAPRKQKQATSHEKLYHGHSIPSPSTTMTSSISQSSEDVSCVATSAAIMTCIEDDREFICNAREQNTVDVDEDGMIKGGWRVGLLWTALRRLPSSLRKRVFLKLLQGSDDGEDIWLWNEGDEALISWDWDWYGLPPPWIPAAMALERRLAGTRVKTTRRREVQSAAFKMRVAMICWLVLTSTEYKSAEKEQGCHDHEEWDMRNWIEVWWYSLSPNVREWLAQHSKSYDDRAFTEVMDQTGHSCHKQTEEDVACWLFMRSQLLPTQREHIIYLRDGYCIPCQAHKPTPGFESPPTWIPSRALVALRCIWDDSALDSDERHGFSKWLWYQPIYGLKEANQFFSSLPQDTDEDKYLSWVNTYPLCLRSTVTGYTLEEWLGMDGCINVSECDRSLNLRSWFIGVWRNVAFWWTDSLPLPTPAPEFCDAIRDSGHTCWDEWEDERDDYTAAMGFLNKDPKVVGLDVRKGSRCHVCCLQWRLKNLGETLLAEELAFSVNLTEFLVLLRKECSRRKVAWDGILTSVEKTFSSRPDSLDGSEESEDGDGGSDDDEASGEDDIVSVALIDPSQDNTTSQGEINPRPETGPWNPSQVYSFHQNIYPNFPGPVSNSDHQEQQDLHYTLDDDDDQHQDIDLNVPHRPQLPISLSLHLTEGITNIFHPDTNILYSHHDSTGSQHDNYSAIPMANPTANEIQDQGNGTRYTAFHEQLFYTPSTRPGDVNYAAYGQDWVPDNQTLVRGFEVLQTQVPGRRSTPLLMSDLVNPSVENDMFSRPRDPGATMIQDDPDISPPADSILLPPRQEMIDKI
ncbi:hypothetical protein C8J56DRAFT_1034132, partial [Mycena floridula]